MPFSTTQTPSRVRHVDSPRHRFADGARLKACQVSQRRTVIEPRAWTPEPVCRVEDLHRLSSISTGPLFVPEWRLEFRDLHPEGSIQRVARPVLQSHRKQHVAGGRVDCDVLVFGNDKESRDIVIGLANEVASAGIDGGVLANSVAAEALTSVLIAINRRYKVAGAGIRITGLSTPVPR